MRAEGYGVADSKRGRVTGRRSGTLDGSLAPPGRTENETPGKRSPWASFRSVAGERLRLEVDKAFVAAFARV
jgi:hypothetical protein